MNWELKHHIMGWESNIRAKMTGLENNLYVLPFNPLTGCQFTF